MKYRPTDVIQKVRGKIYDYHKAAHKVIFLNRIALKTKIEYDNHSSKCQTPNCPADYFYQSVLFFLNEEIENASKSIEYTDFTQEEKERLLFIENTVNESLNKLQVGQEIIYDDLIDEVRELKELLHLSKKNWIQLFSGKLLEMVAGGVIEENTAKQITEYVGNVYNDIFK